MIIKSDLIGRFNVEKYESANAVIDDLDAREITSSSFHSVNSVYEDKSFCGVRSREEALQLLGEGYEPTVEALKNAGKVKLSGTGKRFKFFEAVQGFAPIVPNAIMGIPNAMISGSIVPIKTKVIDVIYDMTCSAYVGKEDILKAGTELLGALLELEAQGYRFNLWAAQSYSDGDGADALMVKIKPAARPLNIRRMSFPLTHPAFFRGIGFEWYSKTPLGKYRNGYGRALCHQYDIRSIQKEFKRIFSESTVYISCQKLVGSSGGYLKGVLTNEHAMA